MNLTLLKIAKFFHLINKSKYNEKIYLDVIRNSDLFDKNWYLLQYTDLKGKCHDAAKHYLKFGWKEGREPGPFFDGKSYLELNPDVAKANICPLLHYELHGKKEKRITKKKVGTKITNENKYYVSYLKNINAHVDEIKQYKKHMENRSNSSGIKVVVYTAISNDYDSLKMPDVISPEIDYICFSNTPMRDTGVWQIKPCPYLDMDPTRICRFIKMHPHTLLKEYDIAIWLDASIIIRKDLMPFVNDFIKSGKEVAALHHPIRTNIYQEAYSCEYLNKDSNELIKKQIDFYKSDGFEHDDLAETGWMMFDLRKEKTCTFLNYWWAEIEKFSKRDQLSLNYCLKKANIEWYPIAPRGCNVRNMEAVELAKHGKGDSIAKVILETLSNKITDPYFVNKDLSLDIGVKTDIVICVHNAYDDVVNCLESVIKYRQKDDTIIIVDDGSEEKTANYLKMIVNKNKNFVLIRNEEATGYTKAANKGLLASSADFVILLNSDTIVTKNWSKKMAKAAFSSPCVGIVGPLSNAASVQSVPSIKDKNNQTAINLIPEKLSVDEINEWCEKFSKNCIYLNVPLVHGFCFGITRDCINKVGVFDETNFPKGYGEENDYCFRAVNLGFTPIVTTDTFVCHEKSKSYSPEKRVPLMKSGEEKLPQLYGEERIRRCVVSMKNNFILEKMRKNMQTIFDYYK